MWNTIIIDTRKMGAISSLMDGMVHIVPENGSDEHCLAISCWCDPRVVWSDEGGTCLVSHKHKRRERDPIYG